MHRIGFAGLGRMGAPMATRLVDAGRDVMVWNRSPGPARSLSERGAHAASLPVELADGCDVIVTMLAGPAAVEQVVTGTDGLLSADRPGIVIVDMSTIGPSAARALAAAAAERDVAFIDAPVSGSVPAAEAGTLACFAGGSRAALDRARPVLEPLTSSVVHVGGSGAGAAVKLSLNTVLAMLNHGIAEALLLAEAEGVDRTTMYDAIGGSALAAPYVGYKRSAFLDGGQTEVAFTIGALSKDLDLALAHGGASGVPLVGAAVARQTLAAAAGLGLRDADIADVCSVLAHR